MKLKRIQQAIETLANLFMFIKSGEIGGIALRVSSIVEMSSFVVPKIKIANLFQTAVEI